MRLTVPLMLLAGSAAAMSSPGYSTDPVVHDDGGGTRASTNYRTDVSIGKDVAGISTSTNYRNELGLVVPAVGAGDVTPPGPVTGLTATAAGDTAVGLSWTNPGDADLAGVAIFRKEGSAPAFTPSAGASYTAGTAYGDSVCVHAGAGTSASDVGLAASTQYYYAAYAFDGVPNYSTVASANATTLAVTVPTVTSAVPVGGATGVVPSTAISVTFSEPMKKPETEGAFSVSPNVTGPFGWNGNTMTFAPGANLAASTKYTVTIGTGAVDLGDVALAAPHQFSFTVKAASSGWYGGGCAPAGAESSHSGAFGAALLLVFLAIAVSSRRGPLGRSRCRTTRSTRSRRPRPLGQAGPPKEPDLRRTAPGEREPCQEGTRK